MRRGLVAIRATSRSWLSRPSATAVARTLEPSAPSAGPTPTGVSPPAEPDLQTLLRKRVPQVVLLTGAAGYGLTEVIGNFTDQGMLRTAAYPAAWILMISAVLSATVIAWFHGERGHQRAPLVEYVVLAVIAVAGLAGSARVFFGG